MVALGMKHLRKAPGFSLQSLLSSPRLWASRDSQPGLLGLGGTACHSPMTYRYCSCSLRHAIGKECALEWCSQQIRLHQLYSTLFSASALGCRVGVILELVGDPRRCWYHISLTFLSPVLSPQNLEDPIG